MFGCTRVEEGLRRHTVGPSFECDATVGDVCEHHRSDAHVVLDDLGLREPNHWVEHLVEVRDLECAASNLGDERF